MRYFLVEKPRLGVRLRIPPSPIPRYYRVPHTSLLADDNKVCDTVLRDINAFSQMVLCLVVLEQRSRRPVVST